MRAAWSHRPAFALVVLAVFLTHGRAYSAAASFDPIFQKLDQDKALVLQANWKEEAGTPVFEARLFGVATSPGQIKLRFRCLTSDAITLTAEQGTHPVQPQTSDPQESDPATESDARLIPSGSGTSRWTWKGIFVVPAGTDVSKPLLWIEVTDGQHAATPIQAYLGDAWVVAGGENAGRCAPSDAGVPTAGFGVAPPGNGKLGTDSPPEPPAVFTCLPPAADPVTWPAGAPHLGARFAVALGRQTGRPQMVVTVARPRKNADYWKDAQMPQLAPLNGWSGGSALGLGVRGAIWWVGEKIAEDDPPIPLLAAEQAPEAGVPPERAALSAAVNDDALRRWQNAQCQTLLDAMGRFADLLTFGSDIPPQGTTYVPLRGRLTFLMVQAPGVARWPSHFEPSKAGVPPWSSWELFRAAQSDAAARWQAPDMQKITFTVSPPGLAPVTTNETIGFRAYLVPALRAGDGAEFDSARWQWDRCTDSHPDDLPRYAALASRLAGAAGRALAWQNPESAANTAVVQWTDADKATVTIAGANGFAAAAAGDAVLEYLDGRSGNWVPVNDWHAPQQVLPLTASETVVAVRYGTGDFPARLRSLTAPNGKDAGILPAFAARRDVVSTVHP